MSVQPITRQDILKKVGELVQNLPDDKLHQIWEQIDLWGAALTGLVDKKIEPNNSIDEEIVEFTVSAPPNTQPKFLRLPTQHRRPLMPATMETNGPAPAPSHFADRLQVNIEWWNQHYEKIISEPSLQLKYVAISNGQIFSGDSYGDVYGQAQEDFPTDTPYIFFVKPSTQPSPHTN